MVQHFRFYDFPDAYTGKAWPSCSRWRNSIKVYMRGLKPIRTFHFSGVFCAPRERAEAVSITYFLQTPHPGFDFYRDNQLPYTRVGGSGNQMVITLMLAN